MSARNPGFEALAGYAASTQKTLRKTQIQKESRLIQVVGVIDDRVTTKSIRQPIHSFTSEIISVARIQPILHTRYIAMLHWIMVDVVESGPESSFVADAGVPIIMPNLSATDFIALV